MTLLEYGFGRRQARRRMVCYRVVLVPPVHPSLQPTANNTRHFFNSCAGAPPKNRAWRKLHLAVDAGTGEIVASDLTSCGTHDCTRVPALLGQIDNRVASVFADDAYDTEGNYEAAHAQGKGRALRVLILPGRDAQLSPRPTAALKERNRNIRSIRRLGRRESHKRSGFSKRSMVENAVYRYNTIIGRCMRSRTLPGQQAEMRIACKILNTMTSLGMPDSYRVR